MVMRIICLMLMSIIWLDGCVLDTSTPKLPPITVAQKSPVQAVQIVDAGQSQDDDPQTDD